MTGKGELEVILKEAVVTFSCWTDKDREHTSCVISSYGYEVDEISALLGYYAAYSGTFSPTFRDNLSGPIFKSQNFLSADLILR
jgi:hypothetical protein